MDEIPIFHSPIFPMFPDVEDLPLSSLCMNQLTALNGGKKPGITATHGHSRPWRPVRRLEHCAPPDINNASDWEEALLRPRGTPRPKGVPEGRRTSSLWALAYTAISVVKVTTSPLQ